MEGPIWDIFAGVTAVLITKKGVDEIAKGFDGSSSGGGGDDSSPSDSGGSDD